MSAGRLKHKQPTLCRHFVAADRGEHPSVVDLFERGRTLIVHEQFGAAPRRPYRALELIRLAAECELRATMASATNVGLRTPRPQPSKPFAVAHI